MPSVTNEEVGRAAEAVLAKAIADQEVPGAVVAVVKDGQVIFERGYGFANLETRTPVNAERTLFYLASLTKTFTATAVMQMVERGKLDLQTDVNRYLSSFQVEPTFPEPVTLSHLLTHSAGFDDKTIGYAALEAGEVRPLGAYLTSALPPRVRPPGQVTAYSNHGYGLAGYLVEIASGETFADFLADNIFRPLGMSRSTANVPLPPDLAPDLATGYEYDYRTQRLVPLPLASRNVPPAGSVSATAGDMARFLIAHLQDGRFEQVRMLRDETARQMHARQFTNHPLLPGMSFGFFEGRYRGERLLQHPGAAPGYSALAVLVPEYGLGVFVATNASALGTNRSTAQAILDVLLPDPGTAPVSPTPPASSVSHAGRFIGCYQSTRYSKHSIEKFAIWDSELCLSLTPSGTLRVEDRRGSRSEWVEIQPLVFRRTTSDELMAFREEAGRITYLFGDQGGFPTAFEKLSWRESIKFQLPLALTLMSILASTFTLWPLGFLIRWLTRHRPGRAARRSPRGVVAVPVLAGMLAVALMAGLDAWIGNSGYRMRLVYGMTPEMVGLLWLAIVFAALAVLLAVFAVQAWRRGWWTRGARAYYSLIAIAALLFAAFLSNWNLLGFRY